MYLEIMVLIALILLVITIVLEVFLLVKNKPMNTLSKFDLEDIKKVVNDTTNEKLENQTRLLKESNNLLFRSLEIKFDNLEKITNKTHQEVNDKLDYLYKFNYEFFNKYSLSCLFLNL